MPANIPFISKAVEAAKRTFTDFINSFWLTPAEKELIGATKALKGTITATKGAEDQPVDVMRVPPGEAHFLTLETQLLAEQTRNPMRALDVGTFTGSSAGALAKGMTYGGEVITCGIDDESAAIAKKYWQHEGIEKLIEHVSAPAGKTMQDLIDSHQGGTFDIVFIDADKPGYDDYYEKALKLVRTGGLIILDNMLLSGKVAIPRNREPSANALRTLDKKIAGDPRVDHVLLNDEDGIMIVKKRDPEHFRTHVSKPTVVMPSR